MYTSPEYPQNLLLAVKEQTQLQLPAKQDADILAGLHYALSTLTQEEQILLQLRYAQSKSLSETAATLLRSMDEINTMEKCALEKLRKPVRWNYIRYGILGWQQIYALEQYNRGYCTGFMDGMAEQKNSGSLPQASVCTEPQPIEILELSARARNCLTYAGCRYIHEVAAMPDDTIQRLRNVGPITAKEIAHALRNAGIPETDWYHYLL